MNALNVLCAQLTRDLFAIGKLLLHFFELAYKCQCKLVLCVSGSCSSFCDSDGCWGPGDDECIQCAGYRMQGHCVEYCDLANGYYANSTTRECWPCNPECLNSCTGPVSLTLLVTKIHICQARFV